MKTQDLDLQSVRQELQELETLLLNRLSTASDESFKPDSSSDESGIENLYASWKRDRVMDLQEKERLEQIRGALRRLDEGDFGKCAKCRREINPERLNSLPYAELCIRCQRKQERSLA